MKKEETLANLEAVIERMRLEGEEENAVDLASLRRVLRDVEQLYEIKATKMTTPKSTKCWAMTHCNGNPSIELVGGSRADVVNMVVKHFYNVDPKDKAARKYAWERFRINSPDCKIKRARIVLEDER